MPATTNGHWNIAATATAVAGIALMLLQPQWWEGVLYTVFQCSLILWLRPRQPAASTIDLADSLTEEIQNLRNRLDERRDLLNRVLPLWDEQIQEAQDQLNMPGGQMTDAAKVRINLVIDAVRADMRRFCEIAGHDHDNRMQPDHWLSAFASTATQPRQLQACAIPESRKKSGEYKTCCEQTF